MFCGGHIRATVSCEKNTKIGCEVPFASSLLLDILHAMRYNINSRAVQKHSNMPAKKQQTAAHAAGGQNCIG